MPSSRASGAQNGLVHAKQLNDMPDFMSNITRSAEQEAGPFQWDDDES